MKKNGKESPMKNIVNRYVTILLAGITLLTPLAFAQPDMAPRMDPLARFKGVLNRAGVLLTADQEANIVTLVEDFRASHQPLGPNDALQTARAAYETAILNGDSAAASAQAVVIGNARAAEMINRETDVAAFGISVVNILRADSSQFNKLIAAVGESGVVRLVLGLAGGPGRPGRPGPGPRL
jgi:hypothetical protein